MERKELIVLAKENGIAKAHQTKTVVLEELLEAMGVFNVKIEKRGRKVDPNSVRQIRLREMETRRVNGELKRGRPVDETSERQVRLKALEEKRVNGELKRGRPSNPNSVRQQKLAAIEAKKAAGIEVKRGRPKKAEDNND